MMRRLILLEGLPCTGKTATAAWLAGQYEARGEAASVLLAGDPRMPTDFEGIAGIPQAAYAGLCARHPLQSANLVPLLITPGYVYLRLDRCPMALAADASRWDMGDARNDRLSVIEYMDCALHRLACWADQTWHAQEVTIMDGGFMQQPVEALLLRGATDAQVAEFLNAASALLRPLDPLCVYLQRGTAAEAIAWAKQARGADWSARMDALQAQPGCADFFARRQRLELAALPPLAHLHCHVDSTDWRVTRAAILRRLMRAEGAA